MKKTLIAALAAIAMVSCGSSYKTKTVTLSGENDSVNYALGIANGAALRMQLGADTTEEVINEFIEALERGYAGKVEEVEPSSPKGIGQSIGMSLKASEKRGLADNPAWALNEKILLQGLVNAILGDTTVLSVEAAGPFFQQQYMASQTDAAPEEVAKAITTTKCPKEAKTIELKNLNDSLNYAFGLLNGTDIQRLVSAEDLDELVEGINSSLKMKAVNPQFRHMGESIGKQIKEQEPSGLVGVQQLDTDFELIKQGFINGLYHFDMDAAEANAYVQNAISRIQYGETKAAGEKFLEENKLKEGVICTESGLQYEVLKMGNGRKPAATDRVRVHYHGTLTDGTVFDSSVERGEPITFGLDQVIKGWTEGVQLMPVGSKFRFYIPEYLGYGERPADQIPPYSTLIFEVELLGIE